MRVLMKVIVVTATVVVALTAFRAIHNPASSVVPIGTGSMQELELRNQDIAFYEKRLVEDPASAGDLAQLAGLYLQRAREAGDYEDFRRAERAARRSVDLRSMRNGKAQMLLASSLLAQHRFAEARIEAEKLVAIDSAVIGYRALLAEIQMELGDYSAAQRSFTGLAHASEELSVAPRLARWHEINGKPGAAKVILEKSLATARKTDLPREQIAWFYLRSGDFSFRHGALRDAEQDFREGLRFEPNDFRLISGLARVEYARGNYQNAISYALLAGDRSDIATLSLLADSYAALGKLDDAARVTAQIVDAAAANPEPYNRQWTQFLLDHRRALPETVSVLEREIVTRPDVLGFDQLAWGYFLSGDLPNAKRAVDQALRMGTHDAALHFHAGTIKLAVGDSIAAQWHFEMSRDINPHFRKLIVQQRELRFSTR